MSSFNIFQRSVQPTFSLRDSKFFIMNKAKKNLICYFNNVFIVILVLCELSTGGTITKNSRIYLVLTNRYSF
jgi:hypothetical protein